MNLINYVKQNKIWDEKAEKLYQVQKLKAYYNKLATELSKELIQLSSEQNSIGKKYVFHNHIRIGTVDYKNIPELKLVDLEKYRKDSTTIWKLEFLGDLTLKKIKG